MNISEAPSAKRCTKCNTEKMIGEYYIYKKKNGEMAYRPSCKACQQKYYLDNVEYRKIYDKEYYHNNISKKKEYEKRYYQDNKEKRKEYQNQYYQKIKLQKKQKVLN